MSGIIDLDELILQCRDKQARDYIKEAVACYKAGAYRSSIVSTWNAIVFDYLHKLNELKLTGDNKAEQKLQEFENIRKNGDKDLKKSLDFEREILNVATEDFELITLLEKTDLNRLQEDRHRCAHPSMQTEDEPYQPTAELSRMHIRNAVEIMLKREPVQGKAAFDRICNQIKSEYFPEDPDAAKVQLEHGPLKRARKVLIRNLVVGITKSILFDKTSKNEKKRQIAALSAILEMHREISEDSLKTDLPNIIAGVSDGILQRPIFITSQIPIYWKYLGEANQEKMKQYVRSIRTEDQYFNTCIYYAFKIEALREIVENRFDDIDINTLHYMISDTEIISQTLKDKIITLFSYSRNFRSAEACGNKLILPLAKNLSIEQLEQILLAVQSNPQIYDASGIEEFLIELFNMTEIQFESLKPKWETLLSFLLESDQGGRLGLTHGYSRLNQILSEKGIVINVHNEEPQMVVENDTVQDDDIPF